MSKARDLADIVASGAILADGTLATTEINGVTASSAELNILDGVTSTTAELNVLDGITATTAELNYVDGVTSNIQTQIDNISPVFTATATGTLANGDTVIVNSDGTVSAVAQSSTSINPPTAGTAVEFFGSTLGNVRGVFDSSANKVVLAIKDNNNDGKAYVGTVSGDSISFGSAVTFETNNIEVVAITFDSNANKVVICYKDEGNSNYAAARVGTVSGTSISFGTKTTFTSSSIGENGITFDSNLNKVVFVYTDAGDSSYGKAVIGTVSGTDISFGTPVTFNAGNTTKMTPTFDSSNNKVVIAYRDNANNNYGAAIVGTVSGTSISFGTEVVFSGTDAIGFKIGATFDSTNNKVVIAYNDTTDSASEVIVGTVSGTSISFGSAVSVNAENNASFHDVEFDSDAGTVLLSFLETSTNDHEFYIGTVSGTSISFGTKLKVAENSTNEVHNVIYDSNAKKAVLAYRDQDDSGKGKAVVISVSSTSTNLTSENFAGISNAAYSNGATATIQIGGAIDDAQSGLTAGQAYYVQADGSLGLSPDSTAVVAGLALSSTKLLIDQSVRDANLTTFGNVFTLPTADGTADQVLKTDGSGSLGFTTVASGGLTHLSTVTAGGASTVDIETTFDSTYDTYQLVVTDLTVNTDGVNLFMRHKIGGSYITNGTYDFATRRYDTDGNATTYSNGFGNGSNINVMIGLGNDAHASADLIMYISNPTDTATRKITRWHGNYFEDDNDVHYVWGIGFNSGTSALTGIRFYLSSGLITGTFRLYGITKGS